MIKNLETMNFMEVKKQMLKNNRKKILVICGGVNLVIPAIETIRILNRFGNEHVLVINQNIEISFHNDEYFLSEWKKLKKAIRKYYE